MAIDAFGDRDRPPAVEEAVAAVGLAGPRWTELCRFAGEECGARSEWAFFGRDDGWMLRYRSWILGHDSAPRSNGPTCIPTDAGST